MLTVLVGENAFAVRQAVQVIVNDAGVPAEHLQGVDVTLPSLIDSLLGMTLFADTRLVVIHELSENRDAWSRLPDWIERIPESTHVVLVEPKPDKRTTTYKTLKAAGVIQEFLVWTDRDRAQASAWVIEHAMQHGLTLSSRHAQLLLDRVGMDQWVLASAIEKLSLLEKIEEADIALHIDAQPSEAVFGLLEDAVAGKRVLVQKTLKDIAVTQDPYRLFGLLTSQVYQLAVVSAAEPGDIPSKDAGIHPYVAGKLQRVAERIGTRRVAGLVHIFAKADADMKRSKTDPWLLIEKALLESSV